MSWVNKIISDQTLQSISYKYLCKYWVRHKYQPEIAPDEIAWTEITAKLENGQSFHYLTPKMPNVARWASADTYSR
jgi:hypothetical protein